MSKFPHLDTLKSWVPALRRSRANQSTSMPLLYCLCCQSRVDELWPERGRMRCLDCLDIRRPHLTLDHLGLTCGE